MKLCIYNHLQGYIRRVRRHRRDSLRLGILNKRYAPQQTTQMHFFNEFFFLFYRFRTLSFLFQLLYNQFLQFAFSSCLISFTYCLVTFASYQHISLLPVEGGRCTKLLVGLELGLNPILTPTDTLRAYQGQSMHISRVLIIRTR